MARKRKDPSDCMGRDQFRMRDFGDVQMPVNTKRSTSDYFVDRSQLGTHTECEMTEEGYKCIERQNHIKQAARDSMGELCHVSQLKPGKEMQENRGFRNVTGRHGASGRTFPVNPSRG